MKGNKIHWDVIFCEYEFPFDYERNSLMVVPVVLTYIWGKLESIPCSVWYLVSEWISTRFYASEQSDFIDKRKFLLRFHLYDLFFCEEIFNSSSRRNMRKVSAEHCEGGGEGGDEFPDLIANSDSRIHDNFVCRSVSARYVKPHKCACLWISTRIWGEIKSRESFQFFFVSRWFRLQFSLSYPITVVRNFQLFPAFYVHVE